MLQTATITVHVATARMLTYWVAKTTANAYFYQDQTLAKIKEMQKLKQWSRKLRFGVISVLQEISGNITHQRPVPAGHTQLIVHGVNNDQAEVSFL